MSTTLIVSDVLALVHGADGANRDLEQHLRERAEAMAGQPPETVREWLAVLGPDAGEDAGVDVLGAALILGIAHPQEAAAHKVTAALQGRRLASAYEEADDTDAAFAVLRIAAEAAPGNASIERAIAALMRRKGMVEELVERYLRRAQRLLDEGESQAAIPWLREVLAIDRSRKDVARMIRDLRFDEVESSRARSRRMRVAFAALALSLGVSGLGFREYRIRQAAAELPAAEHGNLAALQARLTEIEGFVDRYPVWHGALGVLQERSELRVEIDRLQEKETLRSEREADARERQDRLAESARLAGRGAARNGEFRAALDEFEKALKLASDDWPHRDRLERDVAAIREHLGEQDS